VVKKEDLIKAVWPDTFVEESSLTQNISLLRKTLGETPGGQSYIETIPKRGYRFVAQVTEECDAAPGGSGEDLERRPGSETRRWRLWTGALLAVLVAGATVYLRFGRPLAGPPAPLLKTVPLTSFPGFAGPPAFSEIGVAGPPAFSPAGDQVAFSLEGAKRGSSHIFVKLLDIERPLQLTTGSTCDFSPAWSPDGRFIAFLRVLLAGKAAVILVPALGGPERKLTETHWTGSELFPPFLTWSPDSKHLVVVDKRAPEAPTGLFLLSIESGEKHSLIPPPADSIGDSSPAFSPDGRTLAFTRSVSYPVSDVYLLALSDDLRPNGEPKRLTFDNRRCSGFTWTPDGREIVFSSNRLGGDCRLWRISLSGSARPQLVASVGGHAHFPAISRQGPTGGPRLAYRQDHRDRNIWRVAVPGRDGKVIPPVKLIASTRDDISAQYSPDGKKIAFTSDRSGSYEIWVCESDGSNPVPLTSFGGRPTDLPSWSPDGRRIAFHARPEGQAKIYVINAEGGKAQRLTDEQGDHVAPSWSHDGNWIYFGSNRSGIHQVWKIPAEGGTPVQVTKQGGITAFESADGRFLYYTKLRGVTSLWRVPVGGGPESQVLESLAYLNFAVRPEGIYFIPELAAVPGSGHGREASAASPSIQLFRFASRTVRTIAPLEERRVSTLAVSPDGRWILYSRSDQLTSDLMLVENFR
jgi:Tol biopolymer transport system component